MTPSRPALALPALLLLLGHAHAVEPDEVAARLKAAMQAHGASLSWNAVGGSAGAVTIEGATITPAGQSEAIQLGTIELSGVAEAADGALTAERLAAPGYSHKRGNTLVETAGIEIDKLVLPDTQSADAAALPIRFDAMRMDSIKASSRDREVFSASEIAYDMQYPQADGGSIEVDVTAQRFSAQARTPVVDDIADIMGIRAYAGSLAAQGAWNPTGGDVELQSAELLLDNSGTLTLSFAGSGYTREFIQSGQAMNLKLGGGDDLQSVVSQGMAILGAASQVTFDGAALRFEPAAGVKPDPQKAKEARDRIARDLAPFGKRFAEPALAEIDEYLADPRSLEVRAAPTEPVGIATVMLGLMAAPKGLPKQLGLSIKANE